ncbi:cobyrinate a,c-diamide synthase [Prochlorococcus marinus]|uniref:cobyrinate a,c-diamide synthase n=1 Tax=Prochlorococcus marinus TaxID=1219 RepID=UPI001ADC8EE2|nr:cobyrinate a,c-diamide synthase [Prochlorococcus marinus]MBO8204700.1 cobyrinate a,c-diamide synthase [Prochlorococcus marinus CUG1415]MBW3043989.1 cobyrinate a,c-diamide synthase [Prochlorococcus marinus str. MU1415]
MPCVISSPSTDSGKTTLSLLISCWAFSKGIKIQTFKVGPDYLDQQQLSSIGQPICRNLDVFLNGEEWVKESFFKHSLKYEFSLIEGAMGLFDGLGSTTYSSTANVAKLLNVPVIFIVNARGQVASLLATVRGFREFDSELLIAGIIFNNVNSDRHKKLIKQVFKNENIEILGFLPTDSKITLNKANLGLISPFDNGKAIDVEYFASFAERNLDVFSLTKFLISPQKKIFNSVSFEDFKIDKNKPIAIAEDKIFHFQYPETKEFLNEIGIPLISWSIYDDEEIPDEACSLIIPGGFPEKYADHISKSRKSLNSLRKFRKNRFIYAECGGMMILGDFIKDENGNNYKMSGILPFRSKKSKLSVGYRYIKGLKDTPIIKQNQLIRGHEFHYWEIENNLYEFDLRKDGHQNKLSSPWKIKSWETEYKNEGVFDNKLHASWIHLHFPSSLEVAKNLIDATQTDYSKDS